MSCIFLKGECYKLCMACEEIMVVSLDELNQYCHNPHYDLCPIYQQFQAAGMPVPIEASLSYKTYVKG
jgi:hypothetical protein